MKVAFSVGGAAAVLLAAVLTLQSCQTYDFEPVEPLAIAQTTEKKVIYARASKPNIMLVVDKSGSMTQVTTGANTRLTEMQAAMSTYLTTYGKTARMGLTVFPDTSDANSCGTACKPGRILQNVVQSNDVVLFMKGTALFPQCGFSSRAVAILDRLGVQYETVDVLQDPEIRQGIKAFSEWPTIPQLYVKGEFVGGSDIMMEMFESGELQQLVGAEA